MKYSHNNWYIKRGQARGLVGVFNFNLVAAIFGEMSILSRIVYTLVGLSAVYDIVAIKAIWKRWGMHFETPAHA